MYETLSHPSSSSPLQLYNSYNPEWECPSAPKVNKEIFMEKDMSEMAGFCLEEESIPESRVNKKIQKYNRLKMRRRRF